MASIARFDQWQNTLGQNYGTVLQVQHVKGAAPPSTAGSYFSTTSTSFVSTGLSVGITPKFATSKLLVMMSVALNQQGGPAGKGVTFQIWRDGVNATAGGGGNSNSATFVYDANNQDQYATTTANLLLDANSTSATTFTLYCAVWGSGTLRISGHDGQSSITVLEIAQ